MAEEIAGQVPAQGGEGVQDAPALGQARDATGRYAGQVPAVDDPTGNIPQDQGTVPEPEFDLDRAKALIDKLRPYEKTASKLDKDLKTAQAKLQAYEDAKLTDEQKRQKEYEDLKSRHEQASTELRSLKVDGAIERAATAAGAWYPDTVPALLDRSLLEIDEETGRPSQESVAAAIAALKTTRPALFQDGQAAGAGAGGGATKPVPPSGGAPANPSRGKVLTLANVRAMSQEEIIARWDDVQTAVKLGV